MAKKNKITNKITSQKLIFEIEFGFEIEKNENSSNRQL